MSEKTAIGQIKKVGISELNSRSKKLYEVPIVFIRAKGLSDLFNQKIKVYYNQLNQWVEKVVEEVGLIQYIFMESITKTGAGAHDQLKNFLEQNEQLFEMIERLFKMGTSLEQTEDENLFMEYLAWVNDATGPNALEIDQEYVIELMKERSAFMMEKILEKLAESENAFLFITIDLAQVMNYPTDIQAIKFRPPVFDDILKLLRDSR